jgi:hypothetical protein
MFVTALVAGEVGTEFTALACDTAVRDVFYVSGGRETSLVVPALERSAPQTYRGERVMRFFRNEAGAPGEPSRRVEVASVILPEAGGPVLLLWLVTGQNQYSVRALPEDLVSFPLGRARVCNVGPYPVAVNGPDGVLKLAPGETGFMAGDGRRLSVSVASQAEGQWALVGHNIFALSDRLRCTVVLAVSGNEAFQWVQGGHRLEQAPTLRIWGVGDWQPSSGLALAVGPKPTPFSR